MASPVLPEPKLTPAAMPSGMYGDGADKKQHFVQVGISRVGFGIGPHQMVHMGDQPVHKVQTQGARKDSGYGDDQTAVFHGRDDQSQNSCRQHNTGREGQHQITEFVRHTAEGKAQNAAQDSGASHTESCQKNKFQIEQTSLFCFFPL